MVSKNNSSSNSQLLQYKISVSQGNLNPHHAPPSYPATASTTSASRSIWRIICSLAATMARRRGKLDLGRMYMFRHQHLSRFTTFGIPACSFPPCLLTSSTQGYDCVAKLVCLLSRTRTQASAARSYHARHLHSSPPPPPRLGASGANPNCSTALRLWLDDRDICRSRHSRHARHCRSPSPPPPPLGTFGPADRR
jgi:hypothetical protein